jgi:hypothetical protein
MVRRVSDRIFLECAKSFDLLLANSIYTRETLLRTYNLESKVCYLGIDLDHFQSTGEDVENFVMGLGTIYHAKGVDRAIRAIAQVDSKIRPELVWVGNGAWEENLKEYKKLALELKVRFIPKLKISDDEVRSLLSRAAVFMYTSRLEPFGLAPLEANACGTPVVAISEGGVKETIVDGVNGFIVKEEDFVLLGDKVELLVGNRDLRNELSEKSVQYVRECWGFEVGIDNIEKYLIDVSSSDFVAKSSIFKEGNENGVVMYGIDRFELIEGRLCMEGWAFVDDGGCANNWNIFVVVNSGGKELVYPCKKIFRQDVIDECGGSGEVGFNCEGFVESGVVSVRLLLDNGNSVFIQKL